MARHRLSRLPLLAICLAGCINNQNSLNLVSPSSDVARPAGYRSSIDSEREANGPRLVWHDLSWWIYGLRVPGSGALFSVRNGPGGGLLGVVRVVEPAAEDQGVSRVDWYCRQEQVSEHEVNDWLPIGRADAADLRSTGKCMGAFTYAAPANESEKPNAILRFGASAQIVNGDVYDLLTERGDLVGRCHVVKIDVTTSCSIYWAEPTLGKQIVSGQAHALTRPPDVLEAQRFIQPYTRTWPPGRNEPAAAPEPVENRGEGRPAERSALDTNQWVAIAAWSAGAIGIGVGTGVLVSAKSDYSEARPLCDADGRCDDQPYADIQSARTRGWVATGLFGAGAAAVGAGLFFWLARPLEQKGQTAAPNGVQVGVGFSAGQVLVRGRI